MEKGQNIQNTQKGLTYRKAGILWWWRSPITWEAQCVYYIYIVIQRGGVTMYNCTRRQDLLYTDTQGGRVIVCSWAWRQGSLISVESFSEEEQSSGCKHPEGRKLRRACSEHTVSIHTWPHEGRLCHFLEPSLGKESKALGFLTQCQPHTLTSSSSFLSVKFLECWPRGPANYVDNYRLHCMIGSIKAFVWVWSLA